MTNNYYEKFLELKNEDYTDIRGVCKFKTNDIFVSLNESKEVNDNFHLNKIIKSFLWKLRFITRKI